MTESLLTKIRQCTLCANELPLAPKPIFQASRKSRILIAGQAPGKVTHQQGIPFDDKSGERLRRWLGVGSDEFYNPDLFAILPMGFCFPGNGQSGDLPPIPRCAQQWRQQLLDQLNDIELTIILGKHAINWHLPPTGIVSNKQPITTLAKNWQRLIADKKMVLPHPSPRNNIWLKKNTWFEQQVIPNLQQQVSEIIGK